MFTKNENLNVINEGVVRNTYELEKITCTSGISFPNLCAFHATSFYDEKFMTSNVPPIIIPKSVPYMCDLCCASDHYSDSCPQYVWLRHEIENSIENAFNSMEHMMGNIFNQFLELVRTQNEYNFDEEAHMFEETHWWESCTKIIVEASPISLELIGPVPHYRY